MSARLRFNGALDSGRACTCLDTMLAHNHHCYDFPRDAQIFAVVPGATVGWPLAPSFLKRALLRCTTHPPAHPTDPLLPLQAWLSCVALCFLFWPCAFLPFCLTTCQDVSTMCGSRRGSVLAYVHGIACAGGHSKLRYSSHQLVPQSNPPSHVTGGTFMSQLRCNNRGSTCRMLFMRETGSQLSCHCVCAGLRNGSLSR